MVKPTKKSLKESHQRKDCHLNDRIVNLEKLTP